VPNFMQK